jgi:hypothetical protein
MKRVLLSAILLVASCAPQPPVRSGTGTYGGTAGSVSGGGSAGGITSQNKPANSYSQDAVECERKAALSQAGSKGEAFANCMGSRGRTPGRN